MQQHLVLKFSLARKNISSQSLHLFFYNQTNTPLHLLNSHWEPIKFQRGWKMQLSENSNTKTKLHSSKININTRA